MNFLNNSTNTNTSNAVDIFNIESPTPCFQLKIIGVYCSILFAASTISNSALLWTFVRNRGLRSSLNMFIIALTAFNLFGTLVELPFIIASNFSCKWIYGEFGCTFSAYLMYFVGCTSIYLMAAISFERFYIIYRPMSIRHVNLKTNLLIILLCALNGLFWASMPLFGWSHYSLEGAMTSCSVEWKERSFNVTTYNITIFAVVYLVPFITILVTNSKLILIVRGLPKKMKVSQDNQIRKRLASERYMTIVIILLIFTFVVSWTPYAMVAMYSAFINSAGVEPLLGTIPAIIAKSSMLWTSLIYIFSNKNIRSKIFMCFKMDKIQNNKLSKSREKSVGIGKPHEITSSKL